MCFGLGFGRRSADAIGHQIAVLPNGDLVDFFRGFDIATFSAPHGLAHLPPDCAVPWFCPDPDSVFVRRVWHF